MSHKLHCVRLGGSFVTSSIYIKDSSKYLFVFNSCIRGNKTIFLELCFRFSLFFMKIWKSIFYILAVTPWLFIISLMAFYIHAGRILDRPPNYNQPDPKELSIYYDYAPYIDFFASIWICSLMLWVVVSIIYLIVNRKKIEWLPLVMSGRGHFFGFLLLLSGIFEWYVD